MKGLKKLKKRIIDKADFYSSDLSGTELLDTVCECFSRIGSFDF